MSIVSLHRITQIGRDAGSNLSSDIPSCLLTGFQLYNYTTRYYASEITLGHTMSSQSVTVLTSRCLVAAFNGGRSPCSLLLKCLQSQLPDYNIPPRRKHSFCLAVQFLSWRHAWLLSRYLATVAYFAFIATTS
jgi:hypothetical protein